jgi:site-specific recombinase XerC
MSSFPCLVRFVPGSGQVRYRLGERLVDRYLEFVAGRCRPNTLRAVAFDLKAFLVVTGKDPVEVTAADVFEFLADQRGDRTVVRLADGESGLSARTIARRLSSVSGLYAYLVARGDTPVRVNPVPRGLLTRRQGGSRRSRTAPLVRVPRTLPRILSPGEADRLVGALRTHRDRAMVLAMLLAGLRRCEVLGLRFATCRSRTGGWPWWRARAAITGIVPARTGSSTRSARTCMTSGPGRRARTGCSWC